MDAGPVIERAGAAERARLRPHEADEFHWVLIDCALGALESRAVFAKRSGSSVETIATSGAATGTIRDEPNEPVAARRAVHRPGRSRRNASGPLEVTHVEVSSASNTE